MKIDSRFKVRSVAGEYIVVDQGKDQVNMTQIISLNRTAYALWNALTGKDFTAQDAVAFLTAQYGITAEQAQADAEKFFQSMRQCNILHD